MTRVLLVGYAPEAVDFSDPALPPGLTPEKLQASLDAAMQDMAARGWQAERCMLRPDESAVPTLEKHLAGTSYDCVVVGGGVRLASNGLERFEAIVNAVRRLSPQTPIAFNTSPENTAAAAARWVGG